MLLAAGALPALLRLAQSTEAVGPRALSALLSITADSACASSLVSDGATPPLARQLADKQSDSPTLIEQRLLLLSNLIAASVVGKGEARSQGIVGSAKALLGHGDPGVRRAATWLLSVWARDGTYCIVAVRCVSCIVCCVTAAVVFVFACLRWLAALLFPTCFFLTYCGVLLHVATSAAELIDAGVLTPLVKLNKSSEQSVGAASVALVDVLCGYGMCCFLFSCLTD